MEKFTMNDTTIAFIGLGLIGGSLAKGIKKARPDIRIMAYMRTRSKLEQAKKDGIVDVILDGIDEQLKQCDLIFLCTPVEYNAQYLSKIRFKTGGFDHGCWQHQDRHPQRDPASGTYRLFCRRASHGRF